MKKKKILKRLEKAIKAQQMCQLYLEFNPEEACRFQPVKMSEKLILLIKEGNPSKQGYVIRCLDNIEKVKVEDEAVKNKNGEDKKNTKEILEMDLTDWPAVFNHLGKLGEVVVVECEAQEKKDANYAIGKIEKIGKKQVGIRYYGPDSDWADKKWKIPYEEMTRVTIASRYTEVLSKFIPVGEAQAVEDDEN